MADFQIQGLDGVLDKLRSLGPQLQKRALRQAARKAMVVVRDSARQGAKSIDDPQSQAEIYKNIVISESSKRSKQEGGVVMRVGVRGGARPSRNDPKDTGHWRFVEFGKEGVPPRPFMRPALANNVDKVTSTFVASINESLDRIIKTGR